MTLNSSNTANRVVECILAVVLLLAAGIKADYFLINSNHFFLGRLEGRPLVAVLIEAEMLLSVWLLVGGFARLRHFCALACFLLFAAVAAWEAAHAVASCQCFGNVKVPPALTAVFDSSAVVALWLTRPRWDDQRWPSRIRVLFGASAASLATVGLWTAYQFMPAQGAGGISGPVVLEPAGWMNRPFPYLDAINGAGDLKTGRWLLVLYHYDCDDCRQAIPTYQTLATISLGSPNGPHLAFIAVPPIAPAGQDPVAATPEVLRLSLPQTQDWFVTTPLVVALQNGRVLAAADGEQAMVPPDVPQWR
jgi:hypothetical protein